MFSRLASSFEANTCTVVLNEAETTEALDCKCFVAIVYIQLLTAPQVVKYSIMYILVIAILAALIVLRAYISRFSH